MGAVHTHFSSQHLKAEESGSLVGSRSAITTWWDTCLKKKKLKSFITRAITDRWVGVSRWECLPTMYKNLGSIPSSTETECDRFVLN